MEDCKEKFKKTQNNRLEEQSLQHSGNISKIAEQKQDCIGQGQKRMTHDAGSLAKSMSIQEKGVYLT